ncbi:glutathione S-transferase [Sphingomonas sp. PB2P19]|uniref:glutathione S-transferase n=1 Tax=Sphingomonas rhamnosi TaxID=3096156 RepID=UPI002FCC1A70
MAVPMGVACSKVCWRPSAPDRDERRTLLYSFRRCPYAIRARLAIAVSGVKVDTVEVALRDKPAALRTASPKATVPVLVIDDGQVIEQSLDIMRWALTQADPEAWLDGDDAALIATNDGAFKHHLDRYKYAAPADRDGHRDAAAALLAPLETRLSCHANLAGDRRTLVDMALLPFVRQFAQVDSAAFAALPLPGLHRWLARHLASPLFEQVMARPAASAHPTPR